MTKCAHLVNNHELITTFSSSAPVDIQTVISDNAALVYCHILR